MHLHNSKVFPKELSKATTYPLGFSAEYDFSLQS